MNYTSRRAYFSQKTGMIRHHPPVILSVSEESGVEATRSFADAQNDKCEHVLGQRRLTLIGYALISSSIERLMKRSQLWRNVADIDSSNAATSTRTP